jgi:hypothetical protein
MDILSLLGLLGPILSKASGAVGNAQTTNALVNNNAAAARPNIVAGNLRNARLSSMLQSYTPWKLNWQGPGSVAKGNLPQPTGGFGPQSPQVSDLETQIQNDALNQASSNYGLKDPSASSGAATALGAAGLGTSVLGVLGKILGGNAGPSTTAGGDFSGPRQETDPNTFSGPQLPGVGDISSQDSSGPNNTVAYGPEQIAALLQMLSSPSFSGFGGSAREPGGPPDGSAETVGYV